jgi:spermidine synthase
MPRMSRMFEELDYQKTPIGELTLRRRLVPMLDNREVFEVKLGEDYLMSSLFHDAEVALADLGLAGLEGDALDVVVGGLGLGYTAAAALAHAKVRSLVVVDYLEAVIGWHRRGLVPLGETLVNDPRCRFVHADFFALAASAQGFDGGRKFHAVLLDIDHSPDFLLHPANAAFYSPDGLRKLLRHLVPGGAFALWSNDAPDPVFEAKLESTFVSVESRVIEFANPLTESTSTNTVYVARAPAASSVV